MEGERAYASCRTRSRGACARVCVSYEAVGTRAPAYAAALVFVSLSWLMGGWIDLLIRCVVCMFGFSLFPLPPPLPLSSGGPRACLASAGVAPTWHALRVVGLRWPIGVVSLHTYSPSFRQRSQARSGTYTVKKQIGYLDDGL